MTRTHEAGGKAAARNSLEVLFRRDGARAWSALERPRGLKIEHENGRPAFVLSADGTGLEVGRSRETFAAEVIVQQHYTASTDLRYLPRALVTCWQDRGTSVQLRLSALPAEIPPLPDGLAGWEGRSDTQLVYTANPRTLPQLLEALKGALRPAGERPDPSATAEALVTDSSVELPSLELSFDEPEPGPVEPEPAPRPARPALEMTSQDLIAFLERAQDPSDPINLALAPDEPVPDEPRTARAAGWPRPRKVGPRRGRSGDA